jgi:hypothetical protein
MQTTQSKVDTSMKDMYRGSFNVPSPKSDTAIKTIYSREIMDSRGNPTVEVEIVLKNGVRASFKTPFGRFHRGLRSPRTARRC